MRTPDPSLRRAARANRRAISRAPRFSRPIPRSSCPRLAVALRSGSQVRPDVRETLRHGGDVRAIGKIEDPHAAWHSLEPQVKRTATQLHRLREFELAARRPWDLFARAKNRRIEAPAIHAHEHTLANGIGHFVGLLDDLLEPSIRADLQKRILTNPLARNVAQPDQAFALEGRQPRLAELPQTLENFDRIVVVRVQDKERFFHGEHSRGQDSVGRSEGLLLNRKADFNATRTQ